MRSTTSKRSPDPRLRAALVVCSLCGGAACDPPAVPRGVPVPEARAPAAKEIQLVRNAGFERSGASLPASWALNREESAGQGRVSTARDRVVSGQVSLKLEPNTRNVAADPLSVVQIIPAADYRGQEVEFSGYLASEGDAKAILGVMALKEGVPQGPPDLLEQPGGSAPEWAHHAGVYRVPDEPSVQLVLICMSVGQGGASWFDDVSIVPRVTSREAEASDRGEALRATVRVDASTVVRRIPATLYGTNMEWRWNGLGLWLEDERRADPRLTVLARELGVTVLRYPGGYLSDFYHWRDGVGPLDRRRPVLHEPGLEDRSTPYFGTDEVLEFADRIGAEVWITANAGTGTAEEAGAWVRHVNAEGRRVRFWEVGNELYLDLGTPVTDAVTVDPETYARRFGAFARAMREADPGIRLAAIGGENYGPYAFMGYPDWLEIVLQRQADQIDLVSIHNAYAPLVTDEDVDFREVYRAMLAAPTLIGRNLRTVSDLIVEHAPERESEIAIAVTEWGPAFRFDPKSRWLDHVKTLGSALFSASVLKTFVESPRVEVANFQMLHDFGAYGAIGSRNTDFPPDPDWVPTARYYAIQLFTRHFGDLLLKSTSDGPRFDSRAVGHTAAVDDVPYLDVVASLGAEGTRLYVIGINKHFDRPIEAAITIEGFAPASEATAWTLAGTGLDANTGTGILEAPRLRIPPQAEDPLNPRFHEGGEGEISFGAAPITVDGSAFTYRFPPHSATSLVLRRR